jgi:hypothetical protein
MSLGLVAGFNRLAFGLELSFANHGLSNSGATPPFVQGSEESEEDVAPVYGVDGIFGPGVVFTTDLAAELTTGDNDWMIAIPDLDSVGRGQPLLSTLRHSSVFESTGAVPELDVTAGHPPSHTGLLNGTPDALQRTLWDEGSAQPSPAAPITPSLAVLDDSSEAMVVPLSDSSDSSDDEVCICLCLHYFAFLCLNHTTTSFVTLIRQLAEPCAASLDTDSSHCS